MFGRTRRLREALADERARTTILRRQLGEVRRECESWRWKATAGGTAQQDLLIARTRERDEVRKNLRLAEDQLGTARKRLADYGHPHRLTVSDVLEQHDIHRKALADALGPQKCHLNWDQLLTEVADVLAAYRKEAADQTAVIERLTGQLFDALGYLPAERSLLDTSKEAAS